MPYRRILLIVLFISVGLLSCSRRLYRSPYLPSNELVHTLSSSSMLLVNRPFKEVLSKDDLDVTSLFEAIEQSRIYLNRIPDDQQFKYGNLDYSAVEVDRSMALFKQLRKTDADEDSFVRELEKQFYLFESVENFDDQVMLTGYYEPVFEGSLQYSPEYPVPVYTVPDDLMVLDLAQFRDSLKNRTIVYRLENNKIRPYYSREEIMENGVLNGKNLEIAWMKDPIDLLFLQIQGSGILKLPSGEKVKIAYAGANGHPYSSIGRYLVDQGLMDLDDVSMDSIRTYLHHHPDIEKRILYHNKSYTFFMLGDYSGYPKGSINVPLTPNRSVATDLSIFPKASLAFIDTQLPDFDPVTLQYHGLKKSTRYVLVQDTGGAIKGPGRVDLFWGNGRLAEKSAGSMRSFGKIYFLIAKKKFIDSNPPDPVSMNQVSE